MQKVLMEEVYTECGVQPSDVVYVEAHGTGTKAGDPEEVNSIVDLFCKDRYEPLYIGSTKSNMGHPEPASGKIQHGRTLKTSVTVANLTSLQVVRHLVCRNTPSCI